MGTHGNGRLDGKQAVVIGAAGGIGAAIAGAFSDAGATVLGADLSVRAGCGRVRLDVTDEESVAALFAHIADDWSGLDILVNSAGIVRAGRAIADLDTRDFDRTIAVNLRGTFLAMKHAIPLMQRRGGGSIINLSSISASVARPRNSAYVASKGGVSMLTKAAALEYAADGIRVNALCPGVIETDLVGELPEADRAGLIDLNPVGRLGRPEEVAAAAVFLAGDTCRFATGAEFTLDGGRTAF